MIGKMVEQIATHDVVGLIGNMFVCFKERVCFGNVSKYRSKNDVFQVNRSDLFEIELPFRIRAPFSNIFTKASILVANKISK